MTSSVKSTVRSSLFSTARLSLEGAMAQPHTWDRWRATSRMVMHCPPLVLMVIKILHFSSGLDSTHTCFTTICCFCIWRRIFSSIPSGAWLMLLTSEEILWISLATSLSCSATASRFSMSRFRYSSSSLASKKYRRRISVKRSA